MQLQSKLDAASEGERLSIEVCHANQTIRMTDSPGKVIRNKLDSSMAICFDLVKSGEAQAVVSAGNSGAMLAFSLLKLGRIQGIDRPAIMAAFPTYEGQCCLLDMGANVECRPINFAQFAVMGSCFAHLNRPGKTVRVGILSNGSEETKGTELTRSAHRMLTQYKSSDFQYIGYVEGKEIFSGCADVIVTDGYTGNIALKVAEGTISAFSKFLRDGVSASIWAKIGAVMMKNAFESVRQRMDPDLRGAAPLLGVKGISMICHGGASARAIANGMREASRFIQKDFNPALAAAIARNLDMFTAVKTSVEASG